MYPTSFSLYLRLWPYVAFAVAGEIVIQILQERLASSGGLIFVSVLIWSYLAFNAHAALLLPGTRDKREDSRRVLGFALRTFGLGILMVIPVVFGAVVVLSGELRDGALGIDVSDIVAVGLILTVCFLLVFGLLGTLLPAFVADQNRGLRAAFARGRAQFFWMLSQFLAGPVIVFVFANAIIFGGQAMMHPHIDLLNAIYLPNIPMFLILILGYLIQALGTVMIAWVLSKAFLRAEETAQSSPD